MRSLGLIDYQQAWQAMKTFTDSRDLTTADEIWLLEHPPVYTQGQAGKAEHILDAGDIPVVQVDRGGQVTYHGPGQLVAYLLIDIKRLKLGVRELVSLMEDSLIAVLGGYSISAYAKADAPGVYVKMPEPAVQHPSLVDFALDVRSALDDASETGTANTAQYSLEAKIASLGLRVRKGCTFHGLSLNIDCDLAPFAGINPCGYSGMAVTRMCDCLHKDTRVPGELEFMRIAEQVVVELATRLMYSDYSMQNELP